MYAAWFDIDGERFPATALTVSSNQHGRPSFAGTSPSVPEGEIGSLGEVLGLDLERFGISPELVQHAIREARESRLSGEQPETWSPLAGAVRADEYGRWRANEELEAELDKEAPRFAIGDFDSDAHVVISLDIEGQRLASFAYDLDAFIVPFPAMVDEVGVTVLDTAADERLWIRLAAESRAGDPDTLVLWRLYTGSNSWVRDAVTSARSGPHRLVMKGVRSPGLLVGRALRLMRSQQAEGPQGSSFRSTSAQGRTPASGHLRGVPAAGGRANTGNRARNRRPRNHVDRRSHGTRGPRRRGRIDALSALRARHLAVTRDQCGGARRADPHTDRRPGRSHRALPRRPCRRSRRATTCSSLGVRGLHSC